MQQGRPRPEAGLHVAPPTPSGDAPPPTRPSPPLTRRPSLPSSPSPPSRRPHIHHAVPTTPPAPPIPPNRSVPRPSQPHCSPLDPARCILDPVPLPPPAPQPPPLVSVRPDVSARAGPHSDDLHPPLTTVTETSPIRTDSWHIAARWCASEGAGWSVVRQLGVGGTAPVFEVTSPEGSRALKIYDADFSSGSLGAIEHQRIQQQLQLQNHDCPSLVQVYAGGTIEDRLYLLMSRAPGTELEQRLADVPSNKIRGILHNIAQACIFLRDRDICHRDIKAANVFVSDDFHHATLLDISVIRDIHHPVGVGTDRDGQLPVLATTRYCPPEYLFRLVEPGPELWHALTIYQLGALLHDLIAQTPLFQSEYQQSATNRYRFAWLVATQTPRIQRADVDDDLLFLATRALDKNWERRSALAIEDFLHDPTHRERHALQLLGFRPDPAPQPHPDVQTQRLRLDAVSNTLRTNLNDHFRTNGVTTTHEVSPGPHGDTSRTISFTWEVTATLTPPANMLLRITIRLLLDGGAPRFAVAMLLSRRLDAAPKEVTIHLPDVPDDDHADTHLTIQAQRGLSALSTSLASAQGGQL